MVSRLTKAGNIFLNVFASVLPVFCEVWVMASVPLLVIGSINPDLICHRVVVPADVALLFARVLLHRMQR